MAAVNSALIDAIRSGDLNISLPQTLVLQDGTTLHCEKLLRLMPSKRAALIATRDSRTVLAKIFLNTATRQVERERNGFALLRTANQPTPTLLADISFDGGVALLYEYLSNATPLFDENSTPNQQHLNLLFDRLLSMYKAGIYQADLHWGNFLLDRGSVVVIDTGAIAGNADKLLTRNVVIENLGLLIAQFRRGDQPAIHQALLSHQLASEFMLNAAEILTKADFHWQRRKKNLLDKCFRTTSDTVFSRDFNCVWAYRRQYESEDLLNFLRTPDALIATGEALKLGNSSTVVKALFDGRPVVIKRYNMKSFTHWLRRCIRPSRACTSWRNARWLELLGLVTPAPIAFLEMRYGPLRRHAYYVCEYVKGEELLAALQQREPSEKELSAIENYFYVAASDRLIHGDMKATNFLLAEDELVILDLDAMHEEKNLRRWKKFFARDVARFMRNWTSPLPAWLEKVERMIRGNLRSA